MWALAAMLSSATAQLSTLRPIDSNYLDRADRRSARRQSITIWFCLQVSGLQAISNVTTSTSGAPSTVRNQFGYYS